MKFTSQDYRNAIDGLIYELKREMVDIMKKHGPFLDIDDDQGSLIYNHIDDQESEVIERLEFVQGMAQRETTIIAWYGVYDEVGWVNINDLNIPLLINIYDAMLKKINS